MEKYFTKVVVLIKKSNKKLFCRISADGLYAYLYKKLHEKRIFLSRCRLSSEFTNFCHQYTIFIFLKFIGKYYKAIFAIQKAVAEEFISVDPSVRGKTLEQRLKDLEKFLKVATEGGSIDFARTTLGKGLFTFMKVITDFFFLPEYTTSISGCVTLSGQRSL